MMIAKKATTERPLLTQSLYYVYTIVLMLYFYIFFANPGVTKLGSHDLDSKELEELKSVQTDYNSSNGYDYRYCYLCKLKKNE